MQPYSSISPRESFNDVRRNRVGRSSQLRRQFEPFEIWKMFGCELMQSVEEIVCSLLGDEFVMSEIHWSS